MDRERVQELRKAWRDHTRPDTLYMCHGEKEFGIDHNKAFRASELRWLVPLLPEQVNDTLGSGVFKDYQDWARGAGWYCKYCVRDCKDWLWDDPWSPTLEEAQRRVDKDVD